MIVTTSWDDGDGLDERVADLLEGHGLTGTFYVPRLHRTNRLSSSRIRALAARHEIAAHSLTHPDLTVLSRAAKQHEIESSKKWLEDVTGNPVAMFCYPFGRYDDEAKRMVAAAGYQGARTTRQFASAPNADRFALATSLQVYPVPLRRQTLRDFGGYLAGPLMYGWASYFAIVNAMCRGWLNLAETMLGRTLSQQNAVFHLWGHSWEIEQFDMWRDLDVLFGTIAAAAAIAQTNAAMLASLAPRPGVETDRRGGVRAKATNG